MKKMSMVCMVVMFLTRPGLSSPVLTPLNFALGSSEKEAERLRAELRDPAKLREYVETRLLSSDADYVKSEEFMRKFNVSEETILPILMNVIRESSAKTKWKWPQQRKPEDIFIASYQLREAIVWLSVCADAEAKKLLMNIAGDIGKANEFRCRALEAYMCRADAQETRDAIARFLAPDMRATLRPHIDTYYAIKWAYDAAGNDIPKRMAVVAAASFVLEKEEDKDFFVQADKLLAERSTEYAESPQRKAALERMNKPPEKETP